MEREVDLINYEWGVLGGQNRPRLELITHRIQSNLSLR